MASTQCNKQAHPPKVTIDPTDPDLLIPIEMSQERMGQPIQDLQEEVTSPF